MDVLLRDAGPTDAASVAGLLGQLGYPADPTETAARLVECSTDELGRVVIAERGGSVIGVLAFHAIPSIVHAGRRGRIVALVVDRSARGLGVGQQLMRAAEDEALRQRCTDLEVTTERTRSDAMAFYRSLGFEDWSDRSARFMRQPRPARMTEQDTPAEL